MKKLLQIMFVVVLCFSLSLPTSAAVKVSRKRNTLTVKDGTKILFTTPYKKETVYATTTVNARKGPSTSYGRTRTIKGGCKLTRIGKHNGKYSFDVMLINGKTCFISSAYLSNKRAVNSGALYTSSQFKKKGVINWGGWRWTWYSQKILPGKGLKIPGRHTDANGYICDQNEYICLASVDLSKGTVVSTPFGKKGKVYDTGCPKGTLDVYTNF